MGGHTSGDGAAPTLWGGSGTGDASHEKARARTIGSIHPSWLRVAGGGTGCRSRTSSPIRIKRDETFQSLNTEGLFPAGEGAGYAGSILSAGVDGIRVAEAVALSIVGGGRGSG